jgi:hypothetical protein
LLLIEPEPGLGNELELGQLVGAAIGALALGETVELSLVGTAVCLVYEV